MTEKEKMLAGEIYSAVDPQLIEELTEVKERIHDYNLLRPSEKQKARNILKGLLGHIADDEILIIQPFYCDYGKQISVGKRFFANFNFTVLDEATSTSPYSTKHLSPSATTASLAQTSVSTRPAIVQIPWSVTAVESGQSLSALEIMCGLAAASPSCLV